MKAYQVSWEFRQPFNRDMWKYWIKPDIIIMKNGNMYRTTECPERWNSDRYDYWIPCEIKLTKRQQLDLVKLQMSA